MLNVSSSEAVKLVRTTHRWLLASAGNGVGGMLPHQGFCYQDTRAQGCEEKKIYI